MIGRLPMSKRNVAFLQRGFGLAWSPKSWYGNTLRQWWRSATRRGLLSTRCRVHHTHWSESAWDFLPLSRFRDGEAIVSCWRQSVNNSWSHLNTPR